jgi:CBS domain-containing protein
VREGADVEPVVTVPPELPVKQVAALLAEQGISAVPVLDARASW